MRRSAFSSKATNHMVKLHEDTEVDGAQANGGTLRLRGKYQAADKEGEDR